MATMITAEVITVLYDWAKEMSAPLEVKNSTFKKEPSKE